MTQTVLLRLRIMDMWCVWLPAGMCGQRLRLRCFRVQYCLTLAKSNERTVLVSGCMSQSCQNFTRSLGADELCGPPQAGDENINLWQPGLDDLALLATLESEYDAVLAFAARDNTLFAGHQGGVIKVGWLPTVAAARSLTKN